MDDFGGATACKEGCQHNALREEVERLRAEVERARRTAEYWKAEHLAGNAENESLHLLLRGMRAQLQEARIGWDWLTVSNVECAIDAALAGKEK